MIVNQLIYVALVPLAVAAAATFVVRRLRFPPSVAWSAGVALGYLAGQVAVASRGGIARALSALVSPREAIDWLPHAVLLALGVTILATCAPPTWRRWTVGLAAALSVGLPLRLLAGSSYVTQDWTLWGKLSHFALLSATLSLLWLLLATAPDDELPRLRQVLLVLAAVGAAVVTTLAGSFAIGRLCGVVAAAATGTALLAPRGLFGAAGVVTCSLGSLIILGVYYAKLHPANAALLLVAVVGAAGRVPEAVSIWPAAQRAVLRAALCLTSLAIALATSLA